MRKASPAGARASGCTERQWNQENPPPERGQELQSPDGEGAEDGAAERSHRCASGASAVAAMDFACSSSAVRRK